WRTSPEEAVRQRLAPPFHLAASPSRPEPGRLYKATEHRLPPTSPTCCSFVILPSPPRRRSLADRSAELTWPWEMLCPMVTRLRQLRPRTFQFWTFLGTVKCCHTRARRMALVHHANCRTFPRGVPGFFANSCSNVAAETHRGWVTRHDLRGGLET